MHEVSSKRYSTMHVLTWSNLIEQKIKFCFHLRLSPLYLLSVHNPCLIRFLHFL